MSGTWPRRDGLGWRTQLGLSVSLGFALGLSLVLPTTDCVVGAFGDVSTVLRTLWALTTGSATLVSFALTVRKYRADAAESASGDESSDSHTAIHLEGVEGDVDLDVTLGDAPPESRNESDSSPPQTDGDSVGIAGRRSDSDEETGNSKS